MAPPFAAAHSLSPVEVDPVWAAALAAPLCEVPLPPEALAAFEDAIEDLHGFYDLHPWTAARLDAALLAFAETGRGPVQRVASKILGAS